MKRKARLTEEDKDRIVTSLRSKAHLTRAAIFDGPEPITEGMNERLDELKKFIVELNQAGSGGSQQSGTTSRGRY